MAIQSSEERLSRARLAIFPFSKDFFSRNYEWDWVCTLVVASHARRKIVLVKNVVHNLCITFIEIVTEFVM